MTRAVFHSEGITPNLIEVLKSLVTADVMLRAVSLSIRAEMSSCPLALLQSRPHKRSKTSSSVQRSSSVQSADEMLGMSAVVRTGTERLKLLAKDTFNQVTVTHLWHLSQRNSTNKLELSRAHTPRMLSICRFLHRDRPVMLMISTSPVVGMVDGCGYDGRQKDAICDVRGP